MNALVLALAVATQASFVWALRSFFRREGPPQPGMRAIALLGSVSAIAQLGTLVWRVLDPVPFSAPVALGAALMLAAFGLFWWAIAANRRAPLTLAFTEDAPSHLVTWGPYAFIRHPFYASYLAAWLAGALAAHASPLLLSALVMGCLYTQAAVREEDKFARSPLAGRYAAYRRETGVFVPRPLVQARRLVAALTRRSTPAPAKG